MGEAESVDAGPIAWGSNSGEQARTRGAKEGVRAGSWETRKATGRSQEEEEEVHKPLQLQLTLETF